MRPLICAIFIFLKSWSANNTSGRAVSPVFFQPSDSNIFMLTERSHQVVQGFGMSTDLICFIKVHDLGSVWFKMWLRD